MLPVGHCNLNLKAHWNVGKWRAPAFAGAARLSPAYLTHALGFQALPAAPLEVPFVCEEEHPMSDDAPSLFQLPFHDQQDSAAPMSAAHKLCTPSIEMVIGDWHLDEFGNRTREIKARD